MKIEIIDEYEMIIELDEKFAISREDYHDLKEKIEKLIEDYRTYKGMIKWIK